VLAVIGYKPFVIVKNLRPQYQKHNQWPTPMFVNVSKKIACVVDNKRVTLFIGYTNPKKKAMSKPDNVSSVECKQLLSAKIIPGIQASLLPCTLIGKET